MADLKTNYVDDVLDSSKNQLRKYQQIQNDDGTVSFVDVTEYSTTGTSFGAKDINDTNAAVNELNIKMDSAEKSIATKQDASTAITTSNIGSQSVNYANSSNYANSAGRANSAAIADSAVVAERALCLYNGNYGTICASLSNNYIQFRWNTEVNRLDVYVDKTYIGHIVTN